MSAVLQTGGSPSIEEGRMAHGAGSVPASLTIVVANYNHGRFLPRCLSAIVAQTRAPDEVLVIDDASTDDSLSVISTFASRLPNFRLIRRESNCGVVATLNEGLREAAGSHVLFAAADDWIEPELVELSMRMFERHPNAGLCSALTRLATERGDVVGPFRTAMPIQHVGFVAPERAAQLLIEDEGWFNGNTTVVNRSAALELGGYRPELKAFTDGFLNAALALHRGACFIPRFLAVWRRMNTGYASATVADPAAMIETLDAVDRLIGARSLPAFAPAFKARWMARWRFTTARSALAMALPDRRRWLCRALPSGLRWLAAPTAGLASVPAVGGPFATAVLFMALRSRDLGPVLRRRVGWMRWARRLEQAA